MSQNDKTSGRVSREAISAVAGGKPFAQASVRHNLAVQHFSAAQHFCQKVGEIEAAHKGESFGGFFSDIRRNYNACVVACIAALEAYLDEVIDDIGADTNSAKLITRGPLLDRYNEFLRHQGKITFDKGKLPAQNIQALIKLRNAVIHFKPEWDDQAGRHEDLETSLPKREQSPFIGPHEVFFPLRCVSFGYVCWALSSTHQFAEEFSKLAAIGFKFPPLDILDPQGDVT